MRTVNWIFSLLLQGLMPHQTIWIYTLIHFSLPELNPAAIKLSLPGRHIAGFINLTNMKFIEVKMGVTKPTSNY